MPRAAASRQSVITIEESDFPYGVVALTAIRYLPVRSPVTITIERAAAFGASGNITVAWYDMCSDIVAFRCLGLSDYTERALKNTPCT